jgi:hypothetical protein
MKYSEKEYTTYLTLLNKYKITNMMEDLAIPLMICILYQRIDEDVIRNFGLSVEYAI